MIDQRKIEQFEKANRTEVITNVMEYIDDRITYSGVRDIDPIPYLLNCINKLLMDESETGSNAWDIEKYPNPTPLLRKNVWRDICHEIYRRCKGGEKTNFHNPEDYDDDMIGEEDDGFNLETVEEIDSDQEWLEMKSVAEQTDEEAWFYLEALETLVKEHKKIPKRSQLAEYLDCSVDDVTNIQKRIKRRFEENHRNNQTRRRA